MPWFAWPLLALLLCVWLAGWVAVALRPPPLVAYEPRRPVPWNVGELLLMFLLLVAALAAAGPLANFLRGGPLPPPAEGELPALDGYSLGAFSACQLLAAGLLAAWLVLVRRAGMKDLGLSLRPAVEDVLRGLSAFVLIAPPVYVVQLVLTQWFPSEHPLLELLKREPTPGNWALAIFTAVVVAPLVEEFFYRVVLQGWLEKSLSNSEGSPPTGFRGWLPILISAGLFAAMHLGHGPDPIPLALLAIALGWLYRQTHRLLPSLLVHLMLNATSLFIMYLELASN